MSKATTWCSGLVPSMALCAAFAQAGAAAQVARQDSTSLAPSSARVTLEGFVLAPDGSPAEGAVVVSSAGGRTITDVAGSYRLEVEIPLDASSVQVTAVGRMGANLVASARVALSGAMPTLRVDPLALSLGSGCPPSWVPTFGEQPGTDDSISALAVYDDGGGPALYVGGNFLVAGSTAASRIARWDGSSWTALGSGASGIVRALAVYDDGGGPALYAGGAFSSAGGVPVSQVAKWDGSTWSALGSASFSGGAVQALAVYDDGGGPELYAGGAFSAISGVPASKIAKWDGSSWTTLGSGITSGLSVQCLAVYDDGGGPALYAGGGFTSAGGVSANRVAKWDGSTWSALGSGMNQPVFTLVAFDDGSGPALYAGGRFTSAGGAAANRIARWDGSTWTALGSGINQDVLALAAFDDGNGPALYAGGQFSSTNGSDIVRWDGSTWTALGSGMNEDVYSLAVHDDGGGPALYAGGDFTFAGGVAVKRVGKWDGSSWSALGSGLNGEVSALAVHDDGSGPALFAGGFFTSAGSLAANRVAKWDGSSWSALGSGLYGWFRALAVYDDGSGPALYGGGRFTSAGGSLETTLRRWDGSNWSALPLGSSPNQEVRALVVYDDGAGPALYAGGDFTYISTSAAPVPANHIAKWDGSSWSALGGGVDGRMTPIGVGGSTTPVVSALIVHDDGRGPALYAGGDFTVTDSLDGYLAKWSSSDSIPPVISCPPPIHAPDRQFDGEEVVYFTVTAIDDLDPAPVVACVPPPGSTFPLGTTIVTCTATDCSGNQSTCQFPVTVAPKARRR